jgi:hypothetical protein
LKSFIIDNNTNSWLDNRRIIIARWIDSRVSEIREFTVNQEQRREARRLERERLERERLEREQQENENTENEDTEDIADVI